MVLTQNSARVLFIGAERVGRATLARLFETELDIIGVVTAHEDRRDDIADWASFDELMIDHDISYHKVRNSNDEQFVEIVDSLDPDVIFVISWSFIIPEAVVDDDSYTVVGLHYSLLPERRGGAPLNWALIDGLEETGITLYYMEAELDTGDIIAQQRFEIDPDETVADLLDKIVDIAPDFVAEYAGGIASGTAPRREQDEDEATYTPARSPEDSRIDWEQSVPDLYNFIRALTPPYPPAFTFLVGHRLTIPSVTFGSGCLEVEGTIETAKRTSETDGLIMNTDRSPSEPEQFVAEVNHCHGTDEPVTAVFGDRKLELTDAAVREETLHVSGVIE